MTKEEREKAINKIMGYLATYLSVEQYAEAERIIKELRQDTVSRESYEHEYFLRKELDLKVARLERQIAEKQCEDCISRQALIKHIDNAEENFKVDNMDSISSGVEDPFVDGVLSGVFNIRKMVAQAPSVTPIQKWIPTSERLPRQDECVDDVCKDYLIQDEYGDIRVAAYTSYGWVPIDAIYALEDDVVAWMPLPELYKVESEVK